MNRHYTEKLSRLLVIVDHTTSIGTRSDLYKMYSNCKKIYVELDRESVECRRLRHKTAKYESLEQKLNESIQEFEKWVTFSRLL
jgi:diphthamide biosynthesis methyltransferase